MTAGMIGSIGTATTPDEDEMRSRRVAAARRHGWPELREDELRPVRRGRLLVSGSGELFEYLRLVVWSGGDPGLEFNVDHVAAFFLDASTGDVRFLRHPPGPRTLTELEAAEEERAAKKARGKRR